jgi:hypothetical protein
MLPVIPIAQIRVPGSAVPLLGLHLLVDQVKRVNVAGEVAEDGEADVTARSGVSKKLKRGRDGGMGAYIKRSHEQPEIMNTAAGGKRIVTCSPTR